MPCVKLKNKQKIYQLALSLISSKYLYKKAFTGLFILLMFYFIKLFFVQTCKLV